MNKRICVVGAGRWGRNHIRVLNDMGNLGGVVECNTGLLSSLTKQYGDINGHLNIEEALECGYDGYVVATPAQTHYDLGSILLESGQNILLEKPFTLSSDDALELIRLSVRHQAGLMVGHLLLFHPAVRKIKELINDGKIGRLLYIYSTRLNLGTVRTEENVFSSFAPHDVSVLNYLTGRLPSSINAGGGCFLNENIHDCVLTYLTYPDNIKAHIFVSWLHPFKEQRLVIIGDKGMISFDDSPTEKNIYFYNKRIEWSGGCPVKREEATEIVEYERSSPLRNELEYFVRHLDSGITIADGKNGYEVVRVLEEAAAGLKLQDRAEERMSKAADIIGNGAHPGVFIHETSYIDDDVSIGEGTKIWHYSHVQSGARIGRECSIGQNVNIAENVIIGNHVKIQNNVSVYEGVELEDYVFCGPSAVFTNVKNPRCKYPQRGGGFYMKTLVKEGASIGANATIVCNHTIGRHAFIAAGAVVACDVPDYALMAGVPAERVGWVCECGKRLDKGLACENCGRRYMEENHILSEVYNDGKNG